ncbi:MAG: hypothetical protein JWL70_3045, partial [Acidimicrobiia bacterium]|nr:hypothetical protein [Acidimicrobiia bacterium]
TVVLASLAGCEWQRARVLQAAGR